MEFCDRLAKHQVYVISLIHPTESHHWKYQASGAVQVAATTWHCLVAAVDLAVALLQDSSSLPSHSAAQLVFVCSHSVASMMSTNSKANILFFYSGGNFESAY